MRATFAGRIVEIGEIRSGEGKNGPWRSARVVGEEIYGNYVNKVVFDAMNEQLDRAVRAKEMNIMVNIEFYISASTSSKGVLFNNLRVQNITRADGGAASAAAVQQVSAPVPAAELEPDKDDLPF